MKQERSLLALTQDTRDMVAEGLRLASAGGVAVLVYETRRSVERQASLYAQGRTAPGRIVTNARPGYSWHNFDRAIDCVPWEWYRSSDAVQKKLDWSPFTNDRERERFGTTGNTIHLDARWRIMVEAFEGVGLEWAGRWTSFREYVHFQHTDGLTLSGLRNETTTA